MMLNTRFKKYILYPALISLTLMLLTISAQNYSLTVFDKSRFTIDLINSFDAFIGLIDEPEPSLDEFLFVNVAYDRVLVKHYDEKGGGEGNTDITDREKLIKFFDRINSNNIATQYVFLDVLMEKKTTWDEDLVRALYKIDKVVIPYMYDKTSENLLSSKFSGITHGFSNYMSTNDFFYKYILVEENHKSLAVKIYEDIANKNIKRTGITYYDGGKYMQSLIFPRYRLNFLVPDNDRGNEIYNLGYMVNIPNDSFQKLVNGKFVVIADLVDRDIHNTSIGPMPGALIVLNAYLSLMQGEHLITKEYVSLLLGIYFLVAILLIAFPANTNIGQQQVSMLSYLINRVTIRKLTLCGLLLMALTLLSYYLYGKIINILLISLIILILDLLINYLPERSAKKTLFSSE